MYSSKIDFELGCNKYRCSPKKYIFCESISNTSEDGSVCRRWNPCGQAFPCLNIQVCSFSQGVDQRWFNGRIYFIHDWTIYFFELDINALRNDLISALIVAYVKPATWIKSRSCHVRKLRSSSWSSVLYRAFVCLKCFFCISPRLRSRLFSLALHPSSCRPQNENQNIIKTYSKT